MPVCLSSRRTPSTTSPISSVRSPEDLGVQNEDDVVWGLRAAASQERSYRSAYADDGAWPKSVTRDFWDILVTAWYEVGWADDVLDALVGSETRSLRRPNGSST